jgi:hypothetical protein
MKKNNMRGEFLNVRGSLSCLLLALCLVQAGCANNISTPRKPAFDDPGPIPPLAYYQMLTRLSPSELGRERMVLAALPQNPNTQLRMAMLYGNPRGPLDLGKALQQLEHVLKSNDAAAVSLHPLARVLADNYSERQKLEGQADRQTQQLKESQRKAVELQEKLDGLADIERTLPARPRSQRSVAPRSGQ